MSKKTVCFKLIAVCLVISMFILPLGQLPVNAIEETTEIDKVYCNATLDDAFAEDEIIIVINPDWNNKVYTMKDFSEIGCESVKEIAGSKGADVLSRILLLAITDGTKQKVLDAIKLLENREDVHSAEPNYIEEVVDAVDEHLTVSGLPAMEYAPMVTNSAEIDSLWPVEKISLEEAHEIATTTNTVYVGVMDTGVDCQHSYLTSKIEYSLSCSFLGANTDALVDENGHGTHIAGIIAAAENSTIGTVGVCPDAKIVSLKVMDADKNYLYSDVIEGIEYAGEKGIQILNLSGVGTTYSSSLEAAIAGYSGLFVCASGNVAANTDNYPYYPNNFSLPNLISVGASTEDDTKWYLSNYGKATVDIFAPGERVVSCFPTDLCGGDSCGYGSHHSGGYHYMSGTSMAAPFVSGVAALILAKYPTWTPAQIKTKILESADPVGSLTEYCVTGGRLNAYMALHVHSYAVVNVNSVMYHEKRCSCGKTEQVAHMWVTNPGNTYRCSACGYITAILPYAYGDE